VSSPPKAAFPKCSRLTALGGGAAGVVGAGGVAGGFVGGFGAELEDEVVPPLDTGAFVDCAPLAAEPIPALHPQPQSARAIRKTKNRKNSDL
jgi:hypothetical protein